MSTIKLIIFAVAIVIGIPAVSGLAARTLSLESEYDAMCAHLQAAVHATGPLVSVRRFGGDSVFLSDDTLLTRAGPTRFAGVLPKPGGA